MGRKRIGICQDDAYGAPGGRREAALARSH
jgi:hypothetical protein